MLIEAQKTELRENAMEMAEILKQRKIRVPDDFLDQCVENAGRAGRFAKKLSPKDIGNAFSLAEMWRDSILEEEFSKLVLNIVFRLYRHQCVTINNNPVSGKNMYIAEICEVKDSFVPSKGIDRLRRTFITVGGDKVIDKD